MRISRLGLASALFGAFILAGMLYAVFLPQAGWPGALLALVSAAVVGGVVLAGLFFLLMGLLMLVI